MPRTTLAIFDLDGTLIDSRRDLADSANVMLGGYGAPPIAEDDIVRMVGCGAATLVKRVLAAAGVDAPTGEALARFLAAYDERLTHHTRPYQGVPELLEHLHRREIAMALLTNKPLEQTKTILETFKFSKYFRWSVGGDGPWPRKPAPDGLRYLMAQASAGPRETVMIGDSSVDLETAHNAGVRICLARYGFGFAEVAASTLVGDELLADSPGEIVSLLDVQIEV
jgi:phosphoglycolate phosphatase